MPQTPALSFYNGPFAVYTSPTGMTDAITGIPYLGGTLHEGDYVDATREEIAQWNVRFGSSLNTGRYRLVRVNAASTYTSIKYGYPVGWGLPTSVGQVAITAAGTGSGSGSILCSSTAAGGTAATALVNVAAGVITGVQLVYAGASMTSVPTFALTEIATAGITTNGTVVAQMAYSPSLVGSFDVTASIHISEVRGIALTSITAAQIAANSYIVIQELGIAPLYVTTATATIPGSIAASATAAAVTTSTIATAVPTGYIGKTLDTAASGSLVRVVLDLPVVQG